MVMSAKPQGNIGKLLTTGIENISIPSGALVDPDFHESQKAFEFSVCGVRWADLTVFGSPPFSIPLNEAIWKSLVSLARSGPCLNSTSAVIGSGIAWNEGQRRLVSRECIAKPTASGEIGKFGSWAGPCNGTIYCHTALEPEYVSDGHVSHANSIPLLVT